VGLRADGSLWEWGIVGDGLFMTVPTRRPGSSPGGRFTTVPTQVGEDHDWAGIAAGDVHAVARLNTRC